VREQTLSDIIPSQATTSLPLCGIAQSSASQPLLILASTSPRRSQLLSSIGLPFRVVPPLVEEPDPTPEDNQYPARYVERLARAKAEACDIGPIAAATSAQGSISGIIVLAADTVVWHEGQILNKPRDAGEARAMLQSLRGHTHRVLTGVCVRYGAGGQEYQVTHEVTRVTFYDVSDAWIDCYVATGEPMDKAGAYAAQGLGALIIERIEGDFFNVVGLPLGLLGRVLRQIGAPIETWWEKP